MKNLAGICWVALALACDGAKVLKRSDEHTKAKNPATSTTVAVMPTRNDAVMDKEGLAWLNKQVAKNSRNDNRDDSDNAYTEGAEVDSNGFIVVDLYCGFTPKAADHVNQQMFMACEYAAETATNTLRDSGIRNVRIRVVGAEGIESELDLDDRWSLITEENLSESKDMISAAGEAHGADLMLTYVWRNSSLDGNTGKAYVGGTYSLNHIGEWGVTQHELGHNFGLEHCPEAEYPEGNTGFVVEGLNGLGTTMCTDQLPFYSNPKVQVNGHALGDSVTSSVKWLRKALGPISARKTAKYPLDQLMHERKIIASATLSLGKAHIMSNTFAINVTADMPTVWAVAPLGHSAQIFIGKGRPPTPTEYYMKAERHMLQLNHLPTDTYHIGLLTRKVGLEGSQRWVEVWQPSTDFSTSSTSTTTEPPIPEWSADVVYSEACTKVLHKDNVFYNGWYVQGTEPDTKDIYGPWRVRGSPEMFPYCL